MATFTWRSAKECMGCRRLVSWPPTPQGMIGTSWVLWASAHTGTMETCNLPGVVQSMCGQFWYYVNWLQTSTTFIQYTMQGNICKFGRSHKQPILWDYIEIELQETPCGSCYASLCHETTHKIQSGCFLITTALPVCTQFHQIWQIPSISLSPWWNSLPKQNTKEKRIQQIFGSFLHYAGAVDPTIFMVLLEIAS